MRQLGVKKKRKMARLVYWARRGRAGSFGPTWLGSSRVRLTGRLGNLTRISRPARVLDLGPRLGLVWAKKAGSGSLGRYRPNPRFPLLHSQYPLDPGRRGSLCHWQAGPVGQQLDKFHYGCGDPARLVVVWTCVCAATGRRVGEGSRR